MNTVRLYAFGAVVAVVLSSLLFAPLLGLPAGASPSTGDSMGDDVPVFNIYVDAEPEVGDVVIFETHDNDVTKDRTVHRAVEETDSGFVTQGDALSITDQSAGVPHATSENTVGVVVARVTALEISGILMLGTAAVATVWRRGKIRFKRTESLRK